MDMQEQLEVKSDGAASKSDHAYFIQATARKKQQRCIRYLNTMYVSKYSLRRVSPVNKVHSEQPGKKNCKKETTVFDLTY